MLKYIFAYFILLNFGCNGSAQIHEITKSCSELTNSDLGFAQLINKEESGEKLVIYGKVIDKISGQALDNASLFFYQADSNGEYNSTFIGMPSYAKIRGKIKTNTNGCFKIETIVPGNYPGQTDGKHIHVIANAKGYEKWTFEFLFDGWVSESLRREVNQKNDAIILNLLEKVSNKWIVQTEIGLQQK